MKCPNCKTRIPKEDTTLEGFPVCMECFASVRLSYAGIRNQLHNSDEA